jgi:hypothetical protein
LYESSTEEVEQLPNKISINETETPKKKTEAKKRGDWSKNTQA